MKPAVQWPASRIYKRKTVDLIPNARNSRKHSDEQIAQLVASMQEWGWTIPVLIDEKNEIIAGHGRILAAEELEIEVVPVMIAKGWTAAQKRAYLIADNKLTENADWDKEILGEEVFDLGQMDFNMNAIGFDDFDLKKLFGDEDDKTKVSFNIDTSDKFQLLLEYDNEKQLQKAFEEAQKKGIKCKIIQ